MTKQEKEKKNNTMIMKKSSSFETETPYSPLKKVVEFSFSLKQNAVEYEDKDVYYVQGYLDIHPNGYGILRKNGFIPDEDDTYLTLALVKKHNLKKGHYICGKAKHILVGKPKIMYEIEDIDNKKKIAQDFENMSYNGIGAEYYLDKFALKMCKGA